MVKPQGLASSVEEVPDLLCGAGSEAKLNSPAGVVAAARAGSEPLLEECVIGGGSEPGM